MTQTIPDVQNSPDQRNLPINRVGIKAIRHPLAFQLADGSVQHTVAMANLYVHLPAHLKGTHMSRFVQLLNDQQTPLSSADMQTLMVRMLDKLEANAGIIELAFPLFINKAAPVSGVMSLLDYDVRLSAEQDAKGYRLRTSIMIPVTSLCPCSKKISQYGAHNQRSHITLTITSHDVVDLIELIAIAEQEASCELYGLLKRPDEKYVTERAYENPKFVEDLVRDMAARLDADPRIQSYVVESENFESIHNHSAYALIERDKLAD